MNILGSLLVIGLLVLTSCTADTGEDSKNTDTEQDASTDLFIDSKNMARFRWLPQPRV